MEIWKYGNMMWSETRDLGKGILDSLCFLGTWLTKRIEARKRSVSLDAVGGLDVLSERLDSVHGQEGIGSAEEAPRELRKHIEASMRSDTFVNKLRGFKSHFTKRFEASTHFVSRRSSWR
jgi:hypothetical protein